MRFILFSLFMSLMSIKSKGCVHVFMSDYVAI